MWYQLRLLQLLWRLPENAHRKLKAYGGDFLPRNLWTASRGRKSNPQKWTIHGSIYREHRNLAFCLRFQFDIGIAQWFQPFQPALQYYKYVNGQRIRCTVNPTLGGHQKNNPNIVYNIDFDVTPHQLRHTYITNLLYSGVDPKTVQYLAGHENSKTTMDIYAKIKYNKPEQLVGVVNAAFNQPVAVWKRSYFLC